MSNKKTKSSFFDKCLNGIETVGNKLPHPVTLFAIFSLIIIVLSAILSAMGVSATGELINTATKELETKTVEIISLLSREGISYILVSTVKNFTSFAPLGMVLVAMLGVGVAEKSGYISGLLRGAVSITPKNIITPVVIFLGVMSNIASDAGYVVLIPIGALMFLAFGRHPLAGLAAAFAGVSGGFSANLIIGTLDPLLSGLSTEAAAIIDPSYVVEPTGNLFFMIVSTFLIVIVGTFITNKIVEPRLGTYNGKLVENNQDFKNISDIEKKALRLANFTLLGLIALIIIASIPSNSFFRNPTTGSLISGAPLIDGVVIIIALLFFIPSVVYGFKTGEYKSDKDVGNALCESMSSMGGYIALVFVAAQFVSYFSYTNMGTVLAITGADFLQSIGISGPILMLAFIVLAAFINLFMGSASAKWAIMAPVFIPMFMQLNYSPELVQVAYRIGDSTTNLITPLMSYFAMIVIFAKQYDEDAGIGTIISTMIPYSIAFLISWSILLVGWMLFGLPLGPNAPLMI
ncbi:MAG: AbgT family transporter [Oscillospiraceae bacterium]